MAKAVILEPDTEFGELKVIKYIGHATHLCRCSCGNICEVATKVLISGNKKSCGCKSNNTFIDLTDKDFGEWHVLHKGTKNGYWTCRCSCGTIKEVSGHELRRGATTSCGHARVIGDLTDRDFGEWHVLEKGSKPRYWLCRCSCGTIKEVQDYSLTSGKSQSCGHTNTLYNQYKPGDRFNSLTLVRQLHNQQFEFKCECGNIIQCNINSVKSGNTSSCGCTRIKSRFTTLIESNGDFRTQGNELPRKAWQIETLATKENFIAFLNGLDKSTSRDEAAEQLGVTRTALYEASKRFNINLIDYIDARSRGKSPAELELVNFIKGFYTGEIIQNTRKVIPPLELDIYIPEKHIAIEFNGDYWHSEEYVDRKYHQNKTLQCLNKGIHLIHIFEHEWNNLDKRIKLQNLLISTITERNTVIFGRKTTVQEIDSDYAKEFCKLYHLQGYAASSVNLGCFYNNELVGVMTFGTPRFNTAYEYEIIRLCWKHNISVIGGSEKLFKYFLNNYKPQSVLTYVNLSKFTGNVYSRLGFELESITPPDYIWFNVKSLDILTRYQTQKHKLLEVGLGTEENTEADIMHNLDYVRIYDSGNKRLVYKTC